MEPSKDKYIIPLEILKDAYQNSLGNFEVFKDTTKSIIGFASILFTIISLAEVFGKTNLNHNLALVCVGLYLTIFIVSLFIVKPIPVYGPIALDWEHLHDQFANKTYIEAQQTYVSALISAIELNGSICKKLKILTCIIQTLFGLMVFLTIFLLFC